MDMKKMKRVLCCALCVILSLGTVCAAGCTSKPSPAPDTSSVGSETDKPGETTGTSEETSAQPDEKVRLASLTVSGVETVENPTKAEFAYTVPAGHPRLPLVSAVAADAAAKVEIYQATLAAGQSEGIAAVEVTNGDCRAVYTVTFKTDAAAGFALQYDDRYTFVPSYTLAAGEMFTYKSSDPSVLSVSAAGVVTAKAVSTAPVTVEALVGDAVKDTLRVDRVEKAGLALFLIVGQSNAWGSYDAGETSGAKDSDAPAPGVAYYINANDGNIGARTDISAGRTGFGPALAKRWNELTGEKSLLVHTAISGSPIECWLKGGNKYSSKGNGYDNTLKAYNYVMQNYGADNANWEIIRTGCFWCQGETGQVREWTGSSWNQSNPKIQGSEDYFNKFMKMYADFQADMKIEFFSVMLVRALKQTVSSESLALGLLTDLVPVRAAQYTINHTTDAKLFIASRLCDIARKTTDPNPEAEGWGYMGPESVHRTQKGYNAEGKELAENTFKRLSAAYSHAPESLELLAPDGRTRIEDGGKVTVMQGKDCQLAAIVLPLWNTDPGLSYAVTAGADKASVDKFGKVTFAAGTAVGTTAQITVTADCGLKKTITVEVIEYTAPSVDDTPDTPALTLHWDFNDLSEENGYSDLTLSQRAGSGKYTIENGMITLADRNTDFVLAKPFLLAQNFDWSIEWKGSTSNSSALFGTDYSKNDFIYVAYCTASWNYPFRMVSSTGTAAMIPYGTYAEKNREMNVWKIDYKQETRTMTLYFMGADGTVSEVVGTYTWAGDFTFNITNMFGRYASSSTLVCWNGQMDYITVIARAK